MHKCKERAYAMYEGPCSRSLTLPTSQFAVNSRALNPNGAANGTRGGSSSALREEDRSWWRSLHFLEAEGLTPPVKGTELGAALFEAMDDDRDGATLRRNPPATSLVLSRFGSKIRMVRKGYDDVHCVFLTPFLSSFIISVQL